MGWYGVLGGDDIRAACAPAAPERYRFAYNAVYGEQVRVYDLAIGPDRRGVLDATVLPGGVALGLTTLSDIANLWGGTRDRNVLTPEDTAALRGAAMASGVAGPAPAGIFLRSDSFYWIVSACIDGQFRFNAYPYPSPRFAALQFPVELFRLDRTGVPVNPPRPLDLGPFEPNSRFDSGARAGTGPRFQVEVGRNGLVR